GIAMLLALVCLVAMAWFNTLIGLVFLSFMALGFVYFQLTVQQRAAAPADAMLTGDVV
ncbi:MAG TPA: ethanolamine permease, partial [Pseudomonas sp.]|nr:ethanolamine permease [Pseudomonas sp.]